MDDNIKAILSETLSKEYDNRYVIVDTETGEVLDDANGYGFKSQKAAYKAFWYKNRTKEENKNYNNKKKNVKLFLKEHKYIKKDFEQFAFEIQKGSWGPNDKVNTNLVKMILDNHNITNLEKYGITPYDIFKFLVK